jgi:hypothetical protein
MKSILMTIMCSLLALSLAACPDETKKEEGSETKTEKTDEKEEGSESKEDKIAEPSREDAVKKGITDLFDFVKGDQNEKAAGLIAYRGPDKSRKWKDVCDYGAEMEKSYVDNICNRIKKILSKGEVSFKKFMSEKEGEGEWLIWEVAVGGEKKIFAMLEIKGVYALGDID